MTSPPPATTSHCPHSPGGQAKAGSAAAIWTAILAVAVAAGGVLNGLISAARRGPAEVGALWCAHNGSVPARRRCAPWSGNDGEEEAGLVFWSPAQGASALRSFLVGGRELAGQQVARPQTAPGDDQPQRLFRPEEGRGRAKGYVGLDDLPWHQRLTVRAGGHRVEWTGACARAISGGSGELADIHRLQLGGARVGDQQCLAVPFQRELAGRHPTLDGAQQGTGPAG
jgi:hypothetical protein